MDVEAAGPRWLQAEHLVRVAFSALWHHSVDAGDQWEGGDQVSWGEPTAKPLGLLAGECGDGGGQGSAAFVGPGGGVAGVQRVAVGQREDVVEELRRRVLRHQVAYGGDVARGGHHPVATFQRGLASARPSPREPPVTSRVFVESTPRVK